MSRGRHAFRQTDVTRAIKAAVAAGVEIGRVEVDKDGRIVVIPKGACAAPEPNPWDRAIEELKQ
jgi:hypothetical protein